MNTCSAYSESFLMPRQLRACLLPLTPVMTAEDPWDTNNREKSSRQKDLMMKSCLCAPVPSRVESKDAEAVRRCCMRIRDRPQRQVASGFMCWGQAEVYKPSPPFKNSVTHSHQHHLTEATKKNDQGKLYHDNAPAFHLSGTPLFLCNEFMFS